MCCVRSPRPARKPEAVLEECASRLKKKKPSSPTPTFTPVSFWHKVSEGGLLVLLREEGIQEGAEDFLPHWGF